MTAQGISLTPLLTKFQKPDIIKPRNNIEVLYKMAIVLGIDIGGTTTKIVGFDGNKLITPLFVRANDPVASAYGAFGKFTCENNIDIKDINQVMITGVGSAFVGTSMFGLSTTHASEFDAVGKGGLYLSKLDEAIVVSLGTGTAIIHAKENEITYMGGTGVGGGTVIGLSKKMLGVSNIDNIVELAKEGSLENIDLRISDMTSKDIIPTLPRKTTAANFGKLSDVATNGDIALGVLNMVYESIGMLAVFASRHKEVDKIVLTGNLSILPPALEVFDNLSSMFKVNFIVPDLANYATAIGAALMYNDPPTK